ncbi:OB-fold nucleic acid binding domain-containing protein [Isoptericola sediminis]|uniref:OB-fold nucleic acid binding domain-containing protein n=1 Tax=Isoptericola sediminis TaxID=2733572 RepID=A0A849K6L9_9MICO|nr:OB-fold nucleic acid binding domain-containing protein [Isoptericola sediminis]NNU28611.1 OB-fold nucleic acid binding domain-containing protein [Isoptericola sediminis]
MSLRSMVRSALASTDSVAADEERSAAAMVAGCTALAEVAPRHRYSVAGVLRSVVLHPRQDVPTVEAELYDGSGTLDLVWLGRRQIAGIQPGRRLRVEGMVTTRDGRRAMFNPRYELRARAGE